MQEREEAVSPTLENSTQEDGRQTTHVTPPPRRKRKRPSSDCDVTSLELENAQIENEVLKLQLENEKLKNFVLKNMVGDADVQRVLSF